MRADDREIYQSLPADPIAEDVAFSPDGVQVLIHGPLNDELGITRGINIMDVETGGQVSLFPDMSSAVISASPEGGISFDAPFPTNIANFALSPDGGILISFNSHEPPNRDSVTGLPIDGDHKLEIWDAGTGQYLFDVPYIGLPAQIIVYSPDRSYFAMGSADGISIWDSKTWTTTKKLVGHLGEITDLTFTPDSGTIISTSTDETVRVWSLEE